MLERLAQESGIETPTAEDLARLDRKRKGKKLSNQDFQWFAAGFRRRCRRYQLREVLKAFFLNAACAAGSD